jgi:hypothetical protein
MHSGTNFGAGAGVGEVTTEYSRFLIGLAAAMMIVLWGGPIVDALLGVPAPPVEWPRKIGAYW